MRVILRHIFGSYSRCRGCALSYYKATKIIRFLDCGWRGIATVAEEERGKSLLRHISLFLLNVFSSFGSDSKLVMLL